MVFYQSMISDTGGGDGRVYHLAILIAHIPVQFIPSPICNPMSNLTSLVKSYHSYKNREWFAFIQLYLIQGWGGEGLRGGVIPLHFHSSHTCTCVTISHVSIQTSTSKRSYGVLTGCVVATVMVASRTFINIWYEEGGK